MKTPFPGKIKKHEVSLREIEALQNISVIAFIKKRDDWTLLQCRDDSSANAQNLISIDLNGFQCIQTAMRRQNR